jgi:alkaline phosphatase isozyme conversion protein
MRKKHFGKQFIFSIFLLSLMVACTACGSNKNHISTKYGTSAYTHVQYLQNHLGNRVAGSKAEKETSEYIKKELEKIGYTKKNLEEQKFVFTDLKVKTTSQNIIATKQGISEKEIVVGAHYDSVNTHGVDDNGSGVAVALECAKGIFGIDTPYTIKFVFFGAEEVGVCGSKHYIDSFSKADKSKIQLMVNIDSILAGDKQYIYGGSVDKNGKVINDEAVGNVEKIGKQLGLDIHMNPGKNEKYKVPTTGDWSDHVSFKNEGIAYVYFEAANWDLKPFDGSYQTKKLGEIMHTSKDNLDIINKNFPERAKERLHTFTILLDHVLKSPESMFAKKN